MEKKCGKCKIVKDINEFTKDKSTKTGYASSCKSCEKERHKKYQKNNMEKIREYQKEYREENRNKIKKQKKEWDEKNKEKMFEYQKKYREENKEHLANLRRKRAKEKYYNDINFRLKIFISKTIWRILKEKKNYKKSEDLIGYSTNILKEHLEKQFDENMNWENYGNYWEIDHIIPISYYDFFNEKEIKKCWHYRNLRPLESKENKIKNNKLDMKLIKEYNIEDLLKD